MRIAMRPFTPAITPVAAAAVLAVAALLAATSPASAHGHRHVAGHEFTVGFFVEPAYEGEKNGVDLRVADEDGEPVEGLEETLQVEVRVVDGDASMTLPLRAVFGQPGRYTADFVPTQAGAYSFRFFGTLAGAEIDETFTSEVDSFSSVAPIADLQFPVQVAGGRELQAALTGAVASAADADDAARAAQTRANVALGIAVLGVLVGAAGVAFGLRRSRA